MPGGPGVGWLKSHPGGGGLGRAGQGRERVSGQGGTRLLLHSSCMYHSFSQQILMKHLLCAGLWGDNDPCRKELSEGTDDLVTLSNVRW